MLTLSKTYNLQDNTLVATGGNVGIGTTAPTYQFQITNPTAGSSVARIGSIDYGSSGSVLSVAPGNVYFDAPGVVGGHMTILDSGNVGIGTTAPGYKLDVYNDIAIGGTDALRRDGTYGYLYPWGTGYADNIVRVGGGTNTNMEITGNLTVDSGGSSFAQPVNVGTPTAAQNAATKSYVDSAVASGASGINLVNNLPDGDRNAATNLPTSHSRAATFEFVGAGIREWWW